jgi:serralysin
MATINGGPTSETLPGTSANDTIHGGGGNDTVDGGAGADQVFGDSGSDRLNGNEGGDILVGGSGNDVFDFNTEAEATGDVISDFTRGVDKIDLVDIDAKSFFLFDFSTFGNNAFTFKGDLTQQALGKGDLGFVLHNGVTDVRGDTDGDAQFEVSFTLLGTHFLTSSDFIL